MNFFTNITITSLFVFSLACQTVHKDNTKAHLSKLHSNNSPTSTEKEIKLTLSKTGYTTLYKILSNHKPFNTVLQNNYYFDYRLSKGSEHFYLKDHGFNLRLRTKKNKGVITLKEQIKSKQDANIFSRHEFECEIQNKKLIQKLKNNHLSIFTLDENTCKKTMSSTHHPISKLKQYILNDKMSPLKNKFHVIKMISRNATTRVSSPLIINEKTLNFELDKTSFSKDFITYELEIELAQASSSSSYQDVIHFLKLHNITHQISKKSKGGLSYLFLDP